VAKEELLEFEGLVTEILPDARFRIQLDNGHQLVAYTAGRMKKNRIKTLAGDRAGSISRPPQRNQFRRR
jgi:translation initiation factor IF-1